MCSRMEIMEIEYFLRVSIKMMLITYIRVLEVKSEELL